MRFMSMRQKERLLKLSVLARGDNALVEEATRKAQEKNPGGAPDLLDAIKYIQKKIAERDNRGQSTPGSVPSPTPL